MGNFMASSTEPEDDFSGDQPKAIVKTTLEEKCDLIPHSVTGDDIVETIPFQVLSWKPRALYFPNFATAEQCQSLINKARPRLRPSKILPRKGQTQEQNNGFRTSSGASLDATDAEAVDYIEKKISKVAMIPRDHGEALHVLRYEIGQKIGGHFDTYSPDAFDITKSGQRLASFLLYLSDVEEGGETVFPNENGTRKGLGYDFNESAGLKVKPRRGDGVLFYSLLPNGTIDTHSYHASCPVIKGEKWVATKLLRTIPAVDHDPQPI